MKQNFSIDEILEAVNLLLEPKSKKKLENKNKILPADTERIISQAENYIKKRLIFFSKSLILIKLFDIFLLFNFISL